MCPAIRTTGSKISFRLAAEPELSAARIADRPAARLIGKIVQRTRDRNHTAVSPSSWATFGSCFYDWSWRRRCFGRRRWRRFDYLQTMLCADYRISRQCDLKLGIDRSGNTTRAETEFAQTPQHLHDWMLRVSPSNHYTSPRIKLIEIFPIGGFMIRTPKAPLDASTWSLYLPDGKQISSSM